MLISQLLSLLLIMLSTNGQSDAAQQRWAQAVQDTLIIDLVETGEVGAVNSTVVAAPHIWNIDMQIIDIVPEGTHVDSGDVLVEFDKSTLQTSLDEKQTELEMRQADYRKLLSEQDAKMRELARELEIAAYALKLAEVQLEQMAFESETRRQDGELEVMKAKIALKEAETKIEAQKIIHASARKKQELLLLQARGDVNEIQRQLDQLTIYAPTDGLAVYHTDWDGTKPQAGGKVRPGGGVIRLPDLSRMQVRVRINEVDAAKVRAGHQAVLTLEAFPQKRFTARVVETNIIASELERNSQVRVFDLVLAIAERDSLLKPGMTAQVQIQLDIIPDATILPLACIYEIDGQSVVFPRKSPTKAQPITLQNRNSYFAQVDGIAPGTEVAWQAGDHRAKPLGYAAYRDQIWPSDEERQQFFTEMQRRELTFDYEAFRNRPPEPPGGAPGGTEQVLRQLGLPAGEMARLGRSLQIRDAGSGDAAGQEKKTGADSSRAVRPTPAKTTADSAKAPAERTRQKN